ncbi:hypothetical protein ABD76_12505 [Paenibacillus dendritiformis]|nr:hypothetical protein [Paenibacillus dendritiformis]
MHSYSGSEKLYPSKRKMFPILLGSALFVAVGILLMSAAEGFAVAIGAICACFFAITLIYSLWRILAPRPSLILHEQGFVDNASLSSVGEVNWDEVTDIYVYQFMNQRFIGIKVEKPERVLAPLPSWKRTLLRANRGMVEATVNLPVVAFTEPLDDVARKLRERWEQYKRDQGRA